MSDAGRYRIGEDTLVAIRGWMAKYPQGRQCSAVIPALWLVQQEAGGYLPAGAAQAVGDLLGMAPVRVEEIISFYSMFNTAPVGTFFVQVCGTTPCRLCGAADLIGICTERIGPPGVASACDRFSWLEVECLGACVNAPIVQIGQDFHERLTGEKFDALLDQLENDGASTIGRIGACRGQAGVLSDSALYDGSRATLAHLPNAETTGESDNAG